MDARKQEALNDPVGNSISCQYAGIGDTMLETSSDNPTIEEQLHQMIEFWAREMIQGARLGIFFTR